MHWLRQTLNHAFAIGTAILVGTGIDALAERYADPRHPFVRISGQFALNLVVLTLLSRGLPHITNTRILHHVFFLSVLLNVQQGLFDSIVRASRERLYNRKIIVSV